MQRTEREMNRSDLKIEPRSENLFTNSIYSDSPSHRSSTSRYASRLLSTSVVEDSLSNTFVTVNQSFGNINDTVDQSQPPFLLFDKFLEARRKCSKDEQIFDLLEEYEELCADHLTVLLSLLSKNSEERSFLRGEHLLRNERNTWRLLRILYEDRLKNDSVEMSCDCDTRRSDREVIDTLYDRDSKLRQMQLVIDWLEQNETDAFSEDEAFKLEFYAEGPYYWENTLYNINQRNKLASWKSSEREFCSEMDPDAPFRCLKALQDIDLEDENRLMKYIFRYIRAGKLNDGKQVASKMGYHWLVAALSGWMLHHDPNFESELIEGDDIKHPEGNSNRDIWKYVCWINANNEAKSIYERAIWAALSGNLKVFLHLCQRWSDMLWAYIRVSVDVQIERELRRTDIPKQVTARTSGIINSPSRTSVELPEDYWNGYRTFEEIFRELDAHGFHNDSIEEKCHQQLQKYMILDDVGSMLTCMLDFIQNYSETNCDSYWQMIRCFAHIVLFLKQFNLINNESEHQVEVRVLETYITYLIDLKKIELVAFYVACLPRKHQVIMYSKLLENVNDPSERKRCLKFAKQVDLDVEAVTKCVVEAIRKIPPSHTVERDENFCFDPLSFVTIGSATTPEDKKKIESLDWLFLNGIQFCELLIQGNSLMRYFELLEKVDAARDTFKKLPVDIIDGVIKTWKRSSLGELSSELTNSVKEYLCHKAYFQAYESFDEWIKFYHSSRPREPIKPVSNRFTDKVAFEHSKKQYEAELQQWKVLLAKQAKLTAEKIYNVLVFPDGGWMAEEININLKGVDESRIQQLSQLRKKVIPQLVFVLQSLLHASEDATSCVHIADVIACEQYSLYKEFSAHELKNILKKFRESAIAALNQSADAFDNDCELN